MSDWKGDLERTLAGSFRELESAARDLNNGLSDPHVEAWDLAWKRFPGDLARLPLPSAWEAALQWADADAKKGIFGELALAPYVDACQWYPDQRDVRWAILLSMELVARRWPAIENGEAILRSRFATTFSRRAVDAELQGSYLVKVVERFLAMDPGPMRPANAARQLLASGGCEVRARFANLDAPGWKVHVENDWGDWVGGDVAPDGSGTAFFAIERARLPEPTALWLGVTRPGESALAVARLP